MILTIDAHSVQVLATNGNYYFRLSDGVWLAGAVSVATPPGQIDVVVRELLAERQRRLTEDH